MLNNSNKRLSEELQARVCELLETYGFIVNTLALADYLECSPKSLKYFLQTNRAKAAQARSIPGSREAARKNLTDTEQTQQELAFPDKIPDGYHYIDVIPDTVVGVFALTKDHTRLLKRKAA